MTVGDHLTLGTADERKAWLANMAETCSTREADAAIRAYRERLPPSPARCKFCDVCESKGVAVCVCGRRFIAENIAAGIGDAMGELIDADREERETDIPRDYTVPREELQRLLHFILNPEGEQMAYALDPVGTVAGTDAAIEAIGRMRRQADMRGPTEGASDAATEKALRDLGSSDVGTVFDVRMEHGSGKSRVWEYMGRYPQPGSPDAYRFKDERGEFAHLNHPDWRLVRPPTGEASPDIEEVKAQRDRAEAEADDFEFTLAAVIAQRSDCRAKLGTLIGAVKSTLDYRESAYRKDESWPRIVNGMARRLDAALDAAKGGAPTANPVQPNGASTGPSLPDWTEEERTRAAWGDALNLDPNGAPYTVAVLSSETERLTASADESPPHGWELCQVGTPADGWYCRPDADPDGVFRGTTTEVWGAKVRGEHHGLRVRVKALRAKAMAEGDPYGDAAEQAWDEVHDLLDDALAAG